MFGAHGAHNVKRNSASNNVLRMERLRLYGEYKKQPVAAKICENENHSTIWLRQSFPIYQNASTVNPFGARMGGGHPLLSARCCQMESDGVKSRKSRKTNALCLQTLRRAVGLNYIMDKLVLMKSHACTHLTANQGSSALLHMAISKWARTVILNYGLKTYLGFCCVRANKFKDLDVKCRKLTFYICDFGRQRI